MENPLSLPQTPRPIKNSTAKGVLLMSQPLVTFFLPHKNASHKSKNSTQRSYSVKYKLIQACPAENRSSLCSSLKFSTNKVDWVLGHKYSPANGQQHISQKQNGGKN